MKIYDFTDSIRDTKHIVNNTWIYYPFDGLKENDKGWKFYIPLTPDTAKTVFSRILPYLAKKKIPFKHPTDEKTIVEINTGEGSQTGKNIVIYMPIIKTDIITDLINLLIDCRCDFPFVPHANTFYQGCPLYYRHGEYHKKTENDDRYLYKNKIIDGDILKRIQEEFKNNTARKDPMLESFLLNYPVIEVLKQSGKGGIFKALNLKNNSYQEVILKIGYHLGAVQLNGIDGRDLVSNEIKTIKKIKKFNPITFKIPDLVENLTSNDYKVAVYRFIEGETGFQKLQKSNLSTEKINKCIDSIRELHNSGIIWGDAKIGNFIWDDKNNLYMHDFELSTSVNGNSQNALRTFAYKDFTAINQTQTDLIDFFVSILYDKKIDTQSEIHLKDLVKRDHKDNIKNRCKKHLQSLI
jgi:tRNA A-37 threonylcarbamoyl transferase component Bud32